MKCLIKTKKLYLLMNCGVIGTVFIFIGQKLDGHLTNAKASHEAAHRKMKFSNYAFNSQVPNLKVGNKLAYL